MAIYMDICFFLALNGDLYVFFAFNGVSWRFMWHLLAFNGVLWRFIWFFLALNGVSW
jgi:hypothetical protein